MNCIPRVKKRDAVFLSRYVKGVPFLNGRYTKGVPFLSKMVYKRVRGWTSGGGASPYKTLLTEPPGLAFEVSSTSAIWTLSIEKFLDSPLSGPA